MGSWDPAITVAGLIVGVVVGLTGMGGGALMTPVLVVLFGGQPLAVVLSWSERLLRLSWTVAPPVPGG